MVTRKSILNYFSLKLDLVPFEAPPMGAQAYTLSELEGAIQMDKSEAWGKNDEIIRDGLDLEVVMELHFPAGRCLAQRPGIKYYTSLEYGNARILF